MHRKEWDGKKYQERFGRKHTWHTRINHWNYSVNCVQPHVLTFKNFAFCPQFPTILRTNKDYFLREISLLFSAWQTGVLCVEGTDCSVLYKMNFMPLALGLRLAELGEFTTIPKMGPYRDMLKTGNQILCLYRLIIVHFQLRISCWINIIKLRMKGHSYRHVYNRFTHTCNALLHYTSKLQF